MAEAVALPVRLQTLWQLRSQAVARGLGDCRSGSRLADPCGTLGGSRGPAPTVVFLVAPFQCAVCFLWGPWGP